MTRFPHDEFAKGFFESLLSPFGQVQTSFKISSEVREVDVYFIPNDNVVLPSADLGLLSQCAGTAAVFEPYRNSVSVPQIRACMSKLYDLHAYLSREAKKQQQPELKDDRLPMLWILTPTLSDNILESLGAKPDLETWGEGVYLLPPALKTGIIVLHQLPPTPATIWFRMLGKGRVQTRAITEVTQLPPAHPYRQNALELLGNLKVILETRQASEPEDRDLIMQLSPLYLEKIREAELAGEQRGAQQAEQRGEQRGVLKGQQELVLRLLNRKVGHISTELESRINSLPLAPLKELGEALLDFTQMSDLIGWLDNHQS
jgi:Domain of unknown function (DUF4351)